MQPALKGVADIQLHLVRVRTGLGGWILRRRWDWLFPLVVLVLLAATTAPLADLELAARREAAREMTSIVQVRLGLIHMVLLRLQLVAFGAALGLSPLLRELSRPGKVKWDVPRLLAALPAACLSTAALMMRAGPSAIGEFGWWMLRIPLGGKYAGTLEVLATVLVGYVVITSIRKVPETAERVGLSQVADSLQ